MSQQEKIIDKIKKLIAKANGGTTEAEANELLAAAQRLMLKYNLTTVDVTTTEELKIVEGSQIDYGRLYIEGNAWERSLCAVIARYNFCETMNYTDANNKNFKKITIVGYPENVAVCEYLFEVARKIFSDLSRKRFSALKISILDEHDNGKWKRTALASSLERDGVLPYRTPWLQAYLKGCVGGLAEQLEESWQQQKDYYDSHNSDDSTAVIKINALIKLDEDIALERSKYMEIHHSKAVKLNISSRTSELNAVEMGKTDGKNVKLHKGIANSAKTVGLIG